MYDMNCKKVLISFSPALRVPSACHAVCLTPQMKLFMVMKEVWQYDLFPRSHTGHTHTERIPELLYRFWTYLHKFADYHTRSRSCDDHVTYITFCLAFLSREAMHGGRQVRAVSSNISWLMQYFSNLLRNGAGVPATSLC